jgi:hypothetical protein
MMDEFKQQVMSEWIESMRKMTLKLEFLMGLSSLVFEAHLIDSSKAEALDRIKRALDEIWECINMLEESMIEVERDG